MKRLSFLEVKNLMELVLPNNYVALDEEEMMYLDGGGPNIKALLGVPAVAFAARALWNFMTSNNAATWDYIQTTARMAWAGVKMFWMLPAWAKLAGVVAGVAFIYAIGTWSLFG